MKYAVIGVVLLLVGGFLWWTISPFFITTTVDDALDPAVASFLESAAVTPDEPVGGAPVITTSPLTPLIEGPFAINDTSGHPASGQVRIIKHDGTTTVRFEDYVGTNGPDLFVYLAKDLEAKEFVSLGPARGNVGNINYTVPDDINIEDYTYVLTWCRAFGVLFDYALVE